MVTLYAKRFWPVHTGEQSLQMSRILILLASRRVGFWGPVSRHLPNVK